MGQGWRRRIGIAIYNYEQVTPDDQETLSETSRPMPKPQRSARLRTKEWSHARWIV